MFVPFTSNLCTKLSKLTAGCQLISTLPKTIPLIDKSWSTWGVFVWQEVFLQWQSAGGELLLCFCSFYNGHIVVAIILCDEAHRFPVVPMVVRVVGDKLLCVCLVQSVNLNGTLQGVAQQEHLHLPKRENAKGGGGNCTVTEELQQTSQTAPCLISCSSTKHLRVESLFRSRACKIFYSKNENNN